MLTWFKRIVLFYVVCLINRLLSLTIIHFKQKLLKHDISGRVPGHAPTCLLLCASNESQSNRSLFLLTVSAINTLWYSVLTGERKRN